MSDTTAPNPYLSLSEAFKKLGGIGKNELIDAHVRGDVTLVARKRIGTLVGDAHEEIPRHYFTGYRPDEATAVLLQIDLDSIGANGSADTFDDFERYAVYEWIDVKVGAHQIAALRRSLAGKRPTTAAAETRCRESLVKLMKEHPDVPKSKAICQADEKQRSGGHLGDRAFARAWTAAVNETGATAWSQPGRRPRP